MFLSQLETEAIEKVPLSIVLAPELSVRYVREKQVVSMRAGKSFMSGRMDSSHITVARADKTDPAWQPGET